MTPEQREALTTVLHHYGNDPRVRSLCELLVQDDEVGGTCNVCGRAVRYGERHRKCGQAVMAAQSALRDQISTLQQAWEDTRLQRDELLAHIAGKATLPKWAADWLGA